MYKQWISVICTDSNSKCVTAQRYCELGSTRQWNRGLSLGFSSRYSYLKFSFMFYIICTHDGIMGGGRPEVFRIGAGPPGPGLLGIAGAGRPLAGTGGGARELERVDGCDTPRLVPPGDGGDNLERRIRSMINFAPLRLLRIHSFRRRLNKK